MILYTKDKFTQKNKAVGVGMNKGVKFRAYPNKEQQNLIKQSLGCCRLIYNKGLARLSKKALKPRSKSLNDCGNAIESISLKKA